VKLCRKKEKNGEWSLYFDLREAGDAARALFPGDDEEQYDFCVKLRSRRFVILYGLNINYTFYGYRVTPNIYGRRGWPSYGELSRRMTSYGRWLNGN